MSSQQPREEREVPFGGSSSADAPSWIEELRAHILDHITSERTLLDAYERLADESSDEGVSFLIGLVLGDEKRHHELFRRILNTIDWYVNLEGGEPRLPVIPPEWKAAELREVTAHLLEAEHQDARELRELRKMLKPMEQSTLWGLLVELMELDTKKHQLILAFILDHAR